MRVLPSVGLLLALALLAGFAAWPGVAASDEPVTIYYWGNEYDVLAMDTLRDFENLYDGSDGRPAIKVVMGQSASINRTDDPQRLLCAVAGGDPPDVVFFDRFAVGEWAARGALMSLQEFYEEDLRERPDDPFTLREEQFYTPPWEEATYDGQLFAVPTDTDNRALYYNVDLFQRYADELIAAGSVDPDDPTKPGPPRTWEQLREATRILTEYDDRGQLVQVGFIPNYGNSWLYLYGWLNGGQFMSDDGRTCTLNEPRIAEALVYVTELYDMMGGAERVRAFRSSQEGGDLDPFLANKIAMRIDGDGYIGTIATLRRDMRFDIALAPAPEGKERLGWCGGFSLVIPKGAKHPREAWEFIKYQVSHRAADIRDTAARSQARGSGTVFLPQIRGRKDVTEYVMEKYLYSDPTVDERYKDAKRTFVEAMPFSRYRPVTPVGQLLWNAQVDALENAIYKRFDRTDIAANAQEALDRATARVQAELDRIFEPVDYPRLRWMPIVVAYAVIVVGGSLLTLTVLLRRSRATGYFRHEYYAGYLFALPWFVGFLIFGGGPILFSFFMSMCRYDVFSDPQFLGLRNYIDLFANDDLFYKSLWNTVFMVLGIPLSIAVGIGIALLLNHEIKGIAVYRTLFYLPAIMPAVAASILWIWIFNPQEGILNSFLRGVGLPAPAWLESETWAKPAIVLMGLWGAGGGMIIWLAGLKGIPKHLYEAAEIDGAGPVRRFWNVTLPMLSPYILFNLIMGLIGTFQIFTQAYVMTQGGPSNATLFYAYGLFNNAFRYMKMGYASAMAWVLFAIILILTILQLRISKTWVHYESE